MNHEATIATLNMQLDNCAKDLYEKDKRIAELERQLSEASAPAVEQQPIQWTYGPNVWKDWCTQYFGPDADDDYLAKAVFNLPPMAQKFAQPAAPQAADTGKVREAILKLNPHEKTVLGHAHGAGAYCEGFDHGIAAAAELVASMTAQAPVREVPEGWKLVPIEPTDEMYNAACRAFYAWRYTTTTQPDFTHKDCYRAMIAAAPLPAAPVQQEGGK